MSKEQLIHIFDDSACLTKRQLKDYVTGVMTNEECHAVEVHLNSCPLCNEAVEGMFEQQEGSTAGVYAELDQDFLQEHFSTINPHIHLNSLTHAYSGAQTYHHHKHSRKKAQPLWRTTTVAAALLLLAGAWWYIRETRNISTQKTIAQAAIVEATPGQMPVNEEQSLQDNATTSSPAAAGAATPTDNTIANNTRQEEITTKEPVQNGNSNSSPHLVLFSDKDDAADAVLKDSPHAIKEPAPAVANVASVKEDVSKESAPSADEMEMVATSKTTVKKLSVEVDKLEMAESFYKQGKYDVALAAYNQEMRSNDAARRSEAAIGAAECHMRLGNDRKAREILQKLIDEDSPKKQKAKRLLRDLP